MAVLDADLTAQLTSYLEMIKQPIELQAALDDSETSAQLASLLDEIAALSDKVSVTRDDTDPRKPSFAIARVGTDVSVRFAGIPLGHEFSSLVLALLHVGGHTIKESEAVIDAAQSLSGEYRFETYMSLSCQNCPAVVQALNTLAVLNPNVSHVAIEGGSFQNEVEARNILAVPTVYLNGEVFGQGRMDLAEILAKLDTSGATAAKAAEKMTAEAPYDVLVVGGGPAGATAAIYTARKGIRTGLTAARFGGQVLDTMAIENFISVPYTEGPRLAAGLEEHVHNYDVDVVTGASATKLIPAGTPGTAGASDGLHTVEYDNGGTLKARTVILATGARWRTMGVPGEDEYRNKGVTFCPHCDGPLFKGKRVAVIGGGNSGVEAAIDLAGIVGHVTVVEFLDQLKADDVLVAKLRSMPNVDVIVSARSTQVLGDGSQVTGLEYEDRTTGDLHTVEVEGIFVQIGLLPNTEWLAGAVELSARKEIVIDAHGATSVQGVFAAGDVSTTPYKQIVIALGSGATAALSAFDHLIRTSVPGETVEQAAPALV